MMKVILFWIYNFSGELLNKLIVSITGDLVKKKSPKLYKDVLELFNTRRRYKKRLIAELNAMPFIYKDIDSDILNDYVSIEGKGISISDMKETEKKSLNNLTHKNKAIFFGNAGIGKTTFFRHSAISILSGKPESYLKDSKEKLPVFIQLKALSNIEKSPILKYINDNIKYFEGDSGLKRFEKHAENREIFLFLDGYDEIGFTESTNFIRFELNSLLSPALIEENIDNKYLNKKYYNIYLGLSKCKVWLSTRKEFFDLNRLELTIRYLQPSIRTSYEKDFISLILKGLGENRFILIKKIFDKYKAKSQFFIDNLDEEKFYNDLMSIKDSDILELSQSPLFLTIICYLYVNKIESEKQIEKDWLIGSYDLINKCINTLLNDLDKNKVREIRGVKKEAFLKRRSDYFDEKISFLQYFALNSYINNVTVISEDELEDYAIEYFMKKSSSSNKDIILRDLRDNPFLNNANIVKQILYSGVFLLVPSGKKLYDFPHRRFKESLALNAIKDDSVINLDFSNKSISELVQILFINKEHRRYEIIDLILNSLTNSEEQSIYLNKLIIICLNRVQSFQASNNIEKYIIFCLKNNSKTYLLNNLIKDKNFSQELYINIPNYIQNNELNSLCLSLSLMYFKHFNNSINLISTILKREESFSLTYKMICKIYYLASENRNEHYLLSYFSKSIDDKNYIDAISIIYLDRVEVNYEKIIYYLLNNLDLYYLFYLLFILFEIKKSPLFINRYFPNFINEKLGNNYKYLFYENLKNKDWNTSELLSVNTYSILLNEINETKEGVDRSQRQIDRIPASTDKNSEELSKLLETINRQRDTYTKLNNLLSDIQILSDREFDKNVLNLLLEFTELNDVIKYGIINEEENRLH